MGHSRIWSIALEGIARNPKMTKGKIVLQDRRRRAPAPTGVIEGHGPSGALLSVKPM
jgi:hypothetical protein